MAEAVIAGLLRKKLTGNSLGSPVVEAQAAIQAIPQNTPKEIED